MINFLKAAYLTTLIFVITSVCYQLMLMAWLRALLLGSDRGRLGHQIATIWGKLVFNLTPGWKIGVSGQENLPNKNTPVVMVANHESMTDIWAIYFINAQFRWLSKEEVFKVPMIGHCMRICNYVAIKRGNRGSHEQAMTESADLIRAGLSMLFFPEGTRSETGELKPFKIGAFKLAREMNVPVLPIAMHGAGKLLRKGTLSPCAASVKIKILPEVYDNPEESIEQFAERVRDIISTAHKKLV